MEPPPQQTQQQRVSLCKFVKNLFDMASEEKNSSAVGFSPNGTTLEIRDTSVLAQDILPKYFKHGNLSSLVRQLNNYGFRTIAPRLDGNVTHSFMHQNFCRGRQDLCINIRPKRRLIETPPTTIGSLQPFPTSPSPQQHTATLPEAKRLRTNVKEEQMDFSQPSYDSLLEQNMSLRRQNFQLQERVVQLEDEVRTQRAALLQLAPTSPSLPTMNLATFQSQISNNNTTTTQHLSSNLTSAWWMPAPTLNNNNNNNDNPNPYEGTSFFTQLITKRMMSGFAASSPNNAAAAESSAIYKPE